MTASGGKVGNDVTAMSWFTLEIGVYNARILVYLPGCIVFSGPLECLLLQADNKQRTAKLSEQLEAKRVQCNNLQ